MENEANVTIEPEPKAVDISPVGEQLGKEEAPKGDTDWKHHSRTWEQRAKDSARKVKELEDALAAQSASTDATDQLAALQAKVASLESDLADKEFDNLFNQAIQSSGALHLASLKEGLNRDAFRAEHGSWDSGKLNSYISSLVPAAAAPASVSPGLPQNFSQEAATTTKDVAATVDRFSGMIKKNL